MTIDLKVNEGLSLEMKLKQIDEKIVKIEDKLEDSYKIKPNQRYGITMSEPFTEPLIICPNCQDKHYQYCKVRISGKVHYCFNCKTEFVPIEDKNQTPLPPELNNMEIVMQDDMKLQTGENIGDNQVEKQDEVWK